MGYDKKKLSVHLQTVIENCSRSMGDVMNRSQSIVIAGAGTRISLKSDNLQAEGTLSDDLPQTIAIVDEGVTAFNCFVEEVLLDPEFAEKIGRKAVEEKTKEIIHHNYKSLAEDKEYDILIKSKLLQVLRREIADNYVSLPVVNLDLHFDLLLEDIEFLDVSTLKESINDTLERHEWFGETEEEKAKQKLQGATIFDQLYPQAKTFIRVKVNTHPTNAVPIAVQLAQQSINCIRAFLPVFEQMNLKPYFGLPFELASGSFCTARFSEDDQSGFNVNFERYGILGPCTLDDKKREFLEKNYNFTKLLAILSTPSSSWSQIENVLIRSLQPLGRASIATFPFRRLLDATIGLERLLVPDGQETTTARFSERLALFLGATPAERKEIEKTSKRLYDLRSKIVHAALVKVLEEDAETMHFYGLLAIAKAVDIAPKFAQHSEFIRHIDELKYV